MMEIPVVKSGQLHTLQGSQQAVTTAVCPYQQFPLLADQLWVKRFVGGWISQQAMLVDT